MPDDNPLKVYLLIRETTDPGHAVNCAAHAGAALMIEGWDDPVVQEWQEQSFRKVSCAVTDEQFEKAKTIFPDDFILIRESKLEQPEIALVFKPRRHKAWPHFFRSLRLWGAPKR